MANCVDGPGALVDMIKMMTMMSVLFSGSCAYVCVMHVCTLVRDTQGTPASWSGFCGLSWMRGHTRRTLRLRPVRVCHACLLACRAVLGETDGAKSKIHGFDENKGIVIVCANCLIRMVNESAASMLGYQQPAELVGKNINCIVPPPFSKKHVSTACVTPCCTHRAP